MKYTVGSPKDPDIMGKAIFHYLEHSGIYGIPMLELKFAVHIPSFYTSIHGINPGSGSYISMSTTFLLMRVACYLERTYPDLL